MKKVVLHIADEHVPTLVSLVSDIAEVILVKRLDEGARDAPPLMPKGNGAEKLLELKQITPPPKSPGFVQNNGAEIVHIVGQERSRSSPGAIERIALDLQKTAQSANEPVKLADWKRSRPYPPSTVYTATKWAESKGMIRVEMRGGMQWLVPRAFLPDT